MQWNPHELLLNNATAEEAEGQKRRLIGVLFKKVRNVNELPR